MRKVYPTLPFAVVLAAGVCFLAVAWGQEDDEKNTVEAAKKAAPDVAKLADLVGQPDAFKKQAAVVVFLNEKLPPLMRLMTTADKGGMRIGNSGAFPAGSIELELQMLAKKPPSADQLARQAPDIQRLAEVLCAIAAVTPSYCPSGMKSPGRLRRWTAVADDLGDSARELIKVVQANDAKGLPKVVAKINRSCNDCHVRWRDGQPLADVVQAAAVVNKPEQLKDQAAQLAHRWALDEISSALKPRGQGGLTPGGIEAALLDLAKNPPTDADLPALAPTLQQAAEMVRAVAEATPDYHEEYTPKPGAPDKWIYLADDMKRGSDDLMTAVKANDVVGVKKALGALNQSCTDCHKAFR